MDAKEQAHLRSAFGTAIKENFPKVIKTIMHHIDVTYVYIRPYVT